MGGIQAEVRGRDVGSMSVKSIYRIQKFNAVMAFGTSKIHQDGKFCFQVRAPAAEHIKGAPIILVFSWLSSIRVGVMAQVADGFRRIFRMSW